ncbi:hypothetical protein [Pontibacillus yanchengensis]|uniref:Glycine zipper-like domain-containing protein n=1 Tax=Pontibacillus yanchengensis Y32 TaxID=1385514 RepID=A0A0A2TBF6_9BACI|nr:hypothetical protein [Pontibacillus yanchengensis]KGP72839.1 hypothetical protein N782_10230 [Pontibacillus yanchengensis Y32]
MQLNHAEKLEELLVNIKEKLDEEDTSKLELERCQRIIHRASTYSSNCKACGDYLLELESHLHDLYEKVEHGKEPNVKEHRSFVGNIVSHMQKEHKLVTKGYYMSVFISIGTGLGLVFGSLLFDQLALGLPIGFMLGIAIGAGLDEDAKKKGNVIQIFTSAKD